MNQSFKYRPKKFIKLIERVLGIPDSDYTENKYVFNSVHNILLKYNLENSLSVVNASFDQVNVHFTIGSKNGIFKNDYFDNLSKFVNILSKN